MNIKNIFAITSMFFISGALSAATETVLLPDKELTGLKMSMTTATTQSEFTLNPTTMVKPFIFSYLIISSFTKLCCCKMAALASLNSRNA